MEEQQIPAEIPTPTPTAAPSESTDSAKADQSMNYAGFWIRLGAFVIDLIIIIIISIPINIILRDDPKNSTDAASTVGYLVTLAYMVFLTVKYGGTVGKMALGLRVINEEGKNLDYLKALIRETIGKFISFIVILIGFFWIGFDSKKQGWHDKLAGTYVIKVKK